MACSFIKRRDSGTGFFCEFCKISKNTFFNKTPVVAAFEICNSVTLYLYDSSGIWIESINHKRKSGAYFELIFSKKNLNNFGCLPLQNFEIK